MSRILKGDLHDVGQFTVVTGSDGFRLTSYKWHNSKSMTQLRQGEIDLFCNEEVCGCILMQAM